MRQIDEKKRPVDVPTASEDVSFAAFTLIHTGCGDGLIEVRLGDRMLLEWCPACTVLETFVAPGVQDDAREAYPS